jgi:hypothetical protein
MRKPDLLVCVGLLLLLLSPMSARADGFRLCEGMFALCTAASCTPEAGKDGAVACACEVRMGYSAGRGSCLDTPPTSDAEHVQSRYYPIKSLSVCSNDRVWANCLDKPCTVDKTNPYRATCHCTTEKNKGPYVIAGESYSPTTCTTGIVSSATLADNKAITRYLGSTGLLRPYTINVLNERQSQRRIVRTNGSLD